MESKIGCLTKAVVFTDTTAVTVGYLPANSHIIDMKVAVATAFDAGGADYIDIGSASVANAYADNVNVASTGQATVTQATVGSIISSTNPSQIKAVYVPAGSTPTAGAAYVTIVYAQL